MWMSLMTSGVKIWLRPSVARSLGAFSSAIAKPLSEHQLALAGLEAVVVVELLPTHELAQLGGLAQLVVGELAVDQLGVGVRPLGLDAVNAERTDLAADVDR